MAIIPWKPFRDIDEFFGDDDLFSLVPMRESREPSMDLWETDKEVVAELNIPGVNPDDLEVSVEDGVLRVRGETEEKKEEKDEDRGYWRHEIRKGAFERATRLPAPVNDDKVQASYESGVLKVVMPKKESSSKKKTIKVKKKGK